MGGLCVDFLAVWKVAFVRPPLGVLQLWREVCRQDTAVDTCWADDGGCQGGGGTSPGGGDDGRRRRHPVHRPS